MSVSVVHSPPAVSLAKNPVVFELDSNNVFSSVGTLAAVRMEITSLPANNDTWQFKWLAGGVDLTFTFVNGSLGTSGLSLPIAGSTVNDFIDNHLLPAMRANYYINRDFDVYRSGVFTYWEAKRPGTDYDITFISGNQSWNNGMVLHRAGANQTARLNFRIVLEIYLRYAGETDFIRLERNKIPIGDKVIFDLSETLRNRNAFLLPEPNRLTAFDTNVQNVEYYVRYGEAFGEPLAVQRMTEVALKRSICGGLNSRDDRSTDFLADVANDFLTWNKAPEIREDQPYFLTWLNTTSNSSFWLLMDLFDSEDDLISSRLVLTFNVAQYKQITLPAHYTRAVNGASLNGRVVSRYDVYIQRASTTVIVGNKLNVTIDREPLPDLQYVAYRNNLGAYETLAMRGERDAMATIEQQVAKLLARYDSDYKGIADAVYNTKMVEKMTLRSGYLNEENAFAFLDFLASEQRYLVIGDVHLPIQIENATYPVTRTNKFEDHTYSCTAVLKTEENYSDAGNRIKQG